MQLITCGGVIVGSGVAVGCRPSSAVGSGAVAVGSGVALGSSAVAVGSGAVAVGSGVALGSGAVAAAFCTSGTNATDVPAIVRPSMPPSVSVIGIW